MTYDPDARDHRPGEDQPPVCEECGHFSPHTFIAGCGAEVRDGEYTRRCQCLARNDDPLRCDGGRPGGSFPTACGRDHVHSPHPLGIPPKDQP